MKLIIDFKFFIPAILSFVVAYMTVTSTIDSYIHFAGEANAAAFFMVASMLGLLLTICSFEKIKS